MQPPKPEPLRQPKAALVLTFTDQKSFETELAKIEQTSTESIVCILESSFPNPKENIPQLFAALQKRPNIQALRFSKMEDATNSDDDAEVSFPGTHEHDTNSELGKKHARIAETCDEIFKAMLTNKTIQRLHIDGARIMIPAYSFRELINGSGTNRNPVLTTLALPHLHLVEHQEQDKNQGVTMLAVTKIIAASLQSNTVLTSVDLSHCYIILAGNLENETVKEAIDECYLQLRSIKSKRLAVQQTMRVCLSKKHSPFDEKSKAGRATAQATAASSMGVGAAAAASAPAAPASSATLAHSLLSAAAANPAATAAADVKSKNNDEKNLSASVQRLLKMFREILIITEGRLLREDEETLYKKVQALTFEEVKQFYQEMKKDKQLSTCISNFYNWLDVRTYPKVDPNWIKQLLPAKQTEEAQPRLFTPVAPSHLQTAFDAIFKLDAKQDVKTQVLEKTSEWLIKAMAHESTLMTAKEGFAQANLDADELLLLDLNELLRAIPQKVNIRADNDQARDELYAERIRAFDLKRFTQMLEATVKAMDARKGIQPVGRNGTLRVSNAANEPQIQSHLRKLWMQYELNFSTSAAAPAPAATAKK